MRTPFRYGTALSTYAPTVVSASRWPAVAALPTVTGYQPALASAVKYILVRVGTGSGYRVGDAIELSGSADKKKLRGIVRKIETAGTQDQLFIEPQFGQ